MAKTGLKVASKALGAGDTAAQTGLGVAREAVGWSFGFARTAKSLGLGVASACVRLPASALELTGEGPVSKALRGAESRLVQAQQKSTAALDAASARTDSSLAEAQRATRQSIDGARSKIDATANQEGLYLRMILGHEAQELLLRTWALIKDFAIPLGDVPKLDLFRAAKTWAAAQEATVSPERLNSGFATAIPPDSERLMRFTVAAFGAQRAGKLFDDPGAAKRHRREAAQAALSSAAGSSKQDKHCESFSSSLPSPVEQELFFEDDTDSSVADFPSDEQGGYEDAPTSTQKKIRQLMRAARIQEKKDVRAMRREEQTALRALKNQHKEALKAASRNGRAALKEARAYWKTAAGRGAAALICSGISPEGIEVLLFEEAHKPLHNQPHVPGQIVAIDRVMGCVIVALRGSSCLLDALVDLDCKPDACVLGGHTGLAHAGMLRAAKGLDETLALAVEAGLKKLNLADKRVIVCGHSFGGGVASLLTALWHDCGRFADTELRCIAFACPQVLDAVLAQEAGKHTMSFIVGEDCVPCLGLATAKDLRNALACVASSDTRNSALSCGLGDDMPGSPKDSTELVSYHAAVRQAVGVETDRLFPAGKLVHLVPGLSPRVVGHSNVDELVISSDMVSSHLPRRYLAAIQAAQAAPNRSAGYIISAL